MAGKFIKVRKRIDLEVKLAELEHATEVPPPRTTESLEWRLYRIRAVHEARRTHASGPLH